jgi:quercetin dioxygenase-like cupin family protein
LQLVHLDSLPAHSITQFNSVSLFQSRLARLSSDAHVSIMTLNTSGQIGFHQAVVPQLFVVIKGTGWVCDVSREQIPVAPGQAVWWHAGEWHGAGTAQGMTALVIESESLELGINT